MYSLAEAEDFPADFVTLFSELAAEEAVDDGI